MVKTVIKDVDSGEYVENVKGNSLTLTNNSAKAKDFTWNIFREVILNKLKVEYGKNLRFVKLQTFTTLGSMDKKKLG